MQVSVRLAALPVPDYLDFHSGYSAPRSRIAGISSRIYSYSRIFPNERALKLTRVQSMLMVNNWVMLKQIDISFSVSVNFYSSGAGPSNGNLVSRVSLSCAPLRGTLGERLE